MVLCHGARSWRSWVALIDALLTSKMMRNEPRSPLLISVLISEDQRLQSRTLCIVLIGGFDWSEPFVHDTPHSTYSG